MLNNIDLIKNKIDDFIYENQDLLNEELNLKLNEFNNNLIRDSKEYITYPNKEEINYIEAMLKKNHPILYIINKKRYKYPLLFRINNKKINNKILKYKEKFKKYRNIKKDELNYFIKEKFNIENNRDEPNYSKLALIKHSEGITHLILNDIDNSNRSFKEAEEYKEYSDIQNNNAELIKEENLERFLKNSEIRKNYIKKLILIFNNNIEINENEENLNFDFLDRQLKNIEKLKIEEETKPDEEKNYSLLADILYLEGFIYLKKKNYVNAQTSFNYRNYYSNIAFFSKEEKVKEFINGYSSNPRLLRKKIEGLEKIDFDGKIFDTMYNTSKSIEKKSINNKKREIAKIKFFKSNFIELMAPRNKVNKFNKEFNESLDNTIYYYSKKKSKEDKIVCLSTINNLRDILDKSQDNKKINNNKVIKKDNNFFTRLVRKVKAKFSISAKSKYNNDGNCNLNSDEQLIAENLYNKLHKSKDTNAQYECGKYMEKLNLEIAISHFENAALNGHNEAKIELIKYYFEKFKETKNENLKNEINLLVSTLPNEYEYNKTIAEIYKENHEYEEAIEIYKKILEKAEYEKDAFRVKKSCIDIGDCYIEIGNKKSKDNEKKEEEETDYKKYYKKAYHFYTKSEILNGNGEKVPSFESSCKIIDTCALLGNNKLVKDNLRILFLTLEGLSKDSINNKKSKIEKSYILKSYYYVACNKESIISFNDYERNKKVKEYFEKAAELGSVDSMYELGCLLLNGTEDYAIIKDEEKAIEYFKKAAEYGNLKAKFKLAKIYKDEFYAENKENLAITYFNSIINTENADQNLKIESLIELGDIYALQNTSYDLKNAKDCYNKAIDFCNEFKKLNSKTAEIIIRQEILDFDEKTDNNKIIDTTNNMINYLNSIQLNLEEKEKKFDNLVKIINSKISKYQKKLTIEKINKINEYFTIEGISIEKI